MPAIVQTSPGGLGTALITETTLNGTDTFTYNQGTGQVLVLRNPTGGSITPRLVGDAAGASAPVKGIGFVNATVGYSGGAIAAGAVRAYDLDAINVYLEGVVCSVTTGTGLVATLRARN